MQLAIRRDVDVLQDDGAHPLDVVGCTLVRAVHESAMRIFAALQYDFRKPRGRSVPVSRSAPASDAIHRQPPPIAPRAGRVREQGAQAA